MKRPHAVAFIFIGLIALGSARPLLADLNSDIRTVLQDKALSKGQASIEIIRLPDSIKNPDAKNRSCRRAI